MERKYKTVEIKLLLCTILLYGINFATTSTYLRINRKASAFKNMTNP